MKRFIPTIALAAAVLAVLLPSAATAAHAMPNAVSAVHAIPASSVNREQAVRMAKDYLRYQAFSLKGLIHQLKFEGFSKSDATYGASHSGANWMKQAVRMAKSYLRYQPFSRSGLIHQLEFEGFTHAQAVHGARGAGL
jgi:Host cell surface-exposed lipoprotein